MLISLRDSRTFGAKTFSLKSSSASLGSGSGRVSSLVTRSPVQKKVLVTVSEEGIHVVNVLYIGNQTYQEYWDPEAASSQHSRFRDLTAE